MKFIISGLLLLNLFGIFLYQFVDKEPAVIQIMIAYTVFILGIILIGTILSMMP